MSTLPDVDVAARPIDQEDSFLKLNDIDHLEFWVGNAKQAAVYWKNLGFDIVAYSGLETGNRGCASWVLRQRNIRFVLKTPYSPHDPMASHTMIHGDGVRGISMTVDDAQSAWEATTARGGVSVQKPETIEDQNGTARISAIQCYGQTVVKFIERHNYDGPFLPGYEAVPISIPAIPTGLAAVDHIVGNVELGKMNHWVKWFHEVMGFRQILHFDDEDISTEYSALMSKVMSNSTGRIKFPINEPAEGRKQSQIEEYLNYNMGPGVQHLALITGDIVKTTEELRERGMEFLRVPDTYYESLPERIGTIKESYDDIARLGILADRDDEGYLLQIFTKPIQDRPTLFLEIIQRRGSQGFGIGNFKALFESIELEQERRGNL